MNRKLIFLAAAALASCGCMASTSGDVLVEKETAGAMLADKSLPPFADIQLAWTNYPYRAPSDSIAGETTVDEKGNFKSPEVRPVKVSPEETADLLRRAKKVFAEAGLYDRAKGRGTLRLTLVTQNRWTYGDLFRSFLVETSFIFILPASLRVNYLLTADFETAAGKARTETLGGVKTTFHALLAPLYPFFPTAGREKGLLRQMLWRSATEVYAKVKREGPAADKQAPVAPAASAAVVPPAAAAASPAALPAQPASGMPADDEGEQDD